MRLLRLASIFAAAAAFTVFAQDDGEFAAQMKSCNDACGALKKMEQKTGPAAVKRAEKIGSVYEYMIGFWRQRNSSEAVKWSEEGKAAALQLAASASREDAGKAGSAFSALNSTCKSCHDQHREKTADGKYKIK